MLHGLTGDENSMWVLETALPEGARVVAPRGPFANAGEGYSWIRVPDSSLPAAEAFAPAAQVIARLAAELALHAAHLVIMGFSQGAALALALSALGTLRPAGVVALAAFLPDGDTSRLAGLDVFWGHGTQDDKVPIARARSDVARLRHAGASVVYCEADVGHRLGVECLRGLRDWFQRLPSDNGAE
jgi:phospholipase/carboxylesterase